MLQKKGNAIKKGALSLPLNFIPATIINRNNGDVRDSRIDIIDECFRAIVSSVG